MTAITVNGAFRAQRITGQQRYATEIANRLTSYPGVREVTPQGRWRGSASREWAWALARLPRLARGSTVVSLTARSPIMRDQVLVVHDLFPLTHPEWYSRAYVASHAPALRAQLKQARAVVAVSEPVAAEVQAMYGGTVTVAPNAPSDVFSAARSAPASDLPDGAAPERYLLCVGSLDPRKNLSRLAQAYGALPTATRTAMPLLVVGGSASIYRDAGVAWPDGMRSVGYVSDQTLAALYRHAHAVVFPSLAEGFGLPLVEAAAAGARGLVISDIGVFRWICGDSASYVDPHSVANMSAALGRAIEHGTPPITVDPDRFTWDGSARAVYDVASRTQGVAP